MQSEILDGFASVTTRVFRTSFPDFIPSLNDSISELCVNIQTLIDHFTQSNHAYLDDRGSWWSRDMRWKSIQREHDKYERMYKEVEKWSSLLWKYHQNIVVALNKFASQIRTHLDPNYFQREEFMVNDSLGVYNDLRGYQYIPQEYLE